MIHNGDKITLISESAWRTCRRCGIAIPEFQMPSELRERLLDLMARDRMREATFVLRNASDCDLKAVKDWIAHNGLEHFVNPACFVCGKPLRTPTAKQCRYCKADWH